MEQFVKQLKETNFSLVIHDSITSQVPSIVDKYLGSSLPNAFRKELQANNTTLKKELSELNYKEVIEESVKDHVVKEFKNFLPQCLPKVVSDFTIPIIEESVKAHAVNENVIEESVKDHVVNESTKPNQILKKRDRGDDDQDEDPSAGPNQGKEMKKRRTRKETESSKKSSTPKKITKGKPTSKPSKSRKSRSTNDIIEETMFEMGSDDVDQSFEKRRMILNSLLLMLMLNNLLLMLLLIRRYKRTIGTRSLQVLNDRIQIGKLSKRLMMLNNSHALTDQLDWTNPKGYDRPNMGKRLPLIEKECRLTIPVEIFFNNDLEYLKRDKSERTYRSSITKITATRYTMEEGNIPDLNLSDIEDMLLLIAQQKINNLDGDVIVNFFTALKMFTGSIVVENIVEDVQ
ncbi:hypothetical protein Tco_0443385 [Tanacetum coccineum]